MACPHNGAVRQSHSPHQCSPLSSPPQLMQNGRNTPLTNANRLYHIGTKVEPVSSAPWERLAKQNSPGQMWTRHGVTFARREGCEDNLYLS